MSSLLLVPSRSSLSILNSNLQTTRLNSERQPFLSPGANVDQWSECGVYLCVSADTEMNLHLLHQRRNTVLKAGLTCSRANHQGLIPPPAASRFDLWPQTVAAAAGERSRTQTPAESRAECSDRLLRRRCFWNVTSQDVAEQIGARAVICVRRLGRCAVNHWLIILRRGGKATTSIASIRLFRPHYIIFAHRRPKQSYHRIMASSRGRRAPRSLGDVKSDADLRRRERNQGAR